MMPHFHDGYWFAVSAGMAATDIWLKFGETEEDDPDKEKQPPLGYFNLGETIRSAVDGNTVGSGLLRLSDTEEAILLRMAETLELYAANIRSAMRGRIREEPADER
jgi:hypothetical protein